MAQDLRAFIRSEAANIEAAVFEKKYPAIQYPVLAPVASEGDPWALSVERRTMAKLAEAKRLESFADDWPTSDTVYERLVVKVEDFGSSYVIDEKEARTAMKGGFSLSADKASAARRAVEGELETVFKEGDSSLGWDAFQSPTGAATAASGAKWNSGSVTVATIAKDIGDAIGGVYEATKQMYLPDTLVMPTVAFASLTRLAVPNTSVNGLEWLRTNNAYTAVTGQPLAVYAVHTPLDSAKNDAMVYVRDPDVLRFHLPMPISIHGPDMMKGGLTTQYYVLARSGGLEWRIPAAARHITAVI